MTPGGRRGPGEEGGVGRNAIASDVSRIHRRGGLGVQGVAATRSTDAVETENKLSGALTVVRQREQKHCHWLGNCVSQWFKVRAMKFGTS